jgi:hypothetical protein
MRLVAATALAIGAAVAVPLIGGDRTTSSAYSVTTSAGKVKVKVKLTGLSAEDAENLQHRLKQIGVNAEVRTWRSAMHCSRTPRGVGTDLTPKETSAVTTDQANDRWTEYEFDPAQYRG